ncbi:hypothetical protein [Planctomicrobium piriforme]|uniref:Uncharacterized protein n=1 Tax=Planctomicrobium piriforme TaxID=1576369 RepID=A0A1I3RIL6_9PLAN|nr:hypothetical protein [Planctomicrobium piriforme]SFJ46454.1 hypothetical protein SAMN05421753_12122 [Planctomicrobium piriforme]
MATESTFALQSNILHQVDAIIRASEERSRPLEMDPARSELFDLFAQAEAAGILRDGSDPDLSSDGLCASLSELWGLKEAARQSAEKQTQLPPEHMARMRSLWSVLRMWMEWTYAWDRWAEFHRSR